MPARKAAAETRHPRTVEEHREVNRILHLCHGDDADKHQSRHCHHSFHIL